MCATAPTKGISSAIGCEIQPIGKCNMPYSAYNAISAAYRDNMQVCKLNSRLLIGDYRMTYRVTFLVWSIDELLRQLLWWRGVVVYRCYRLGTRCISLLLAIARVMYGWEWLLECLFWRSMILHRGSGICSLRLFLPLVLMSAYKRILPIAEKAL